MRKTTYWIEIVILCIVFVLVASINKPMAFSGDFVFETTTVRYAIGSDGANKSLLEKQTGREWLKTKDTPFAAIRKGGKFYPVSHVTGNGDVLKAEFGKSGLQADFRVSGRSDAILVELVRLYGDGVEEVRLAQLRVANMKNAGSLIAVRWDDEFTACLMGLSDRVDSRLGDDGLIIASVYPEYGMVGEKVAIIPVPTPHFLSAVQKLEHDLHLPSPKLDGQWAKLSPAIRESYLFIDMTEANADETIRYAKLAGFKYIMIYSNTWSSSLGSYPINTRNFPDGEVSLKAVVDKCHAAGLKVGLHMLTSLVGKNDPLVRTVPDARLLKDAETILAAELDAKTTEIIAVSGLADFPGQPAYYGPTKAGLDIQIDDEIIHYRSVGGTNSNTFVQCIRGYAETKAVKHKSGAKIFHLAERFGSYLADLRTSLKEKISERVAGLINRCGFDMVYFDGGELNVANGPAWYWVGQQQKDILKRVKRDLLVQGSGITPWTWHIFARGTCDDYAAVAPKEYLDYYKIFYVRQNYLKSFMPAELGWWGFLAYTPDHPATTPDEVEHYAVRMLALDAPVSLETNIKDLQENGRTDEMLKILGNYEDLRLKQLVPESVREKLSTGAWHMHNIDGKREFRSVKYEMKPTATPEIIVVKNEFKAQPFKFRLQAGPSLAKVEDRSNIVLFKPNQPNVLKLVETKTLMPGALVDRIEYTKRVGERAGKPHDLTTHRALAVRLKVNGPVPKPGELYSILNIQLEAGGKSYRDHYININFTGERTIIIPEPTTERMLREFWPAYANYAFKAAMYHFNYKDVVALNIRWMRQPVVKQIECSISLIEALSETESVLDKPEMSVGSATIILPVKLQTDDYAEYWGDGLIRVFNRNGVQLSAVEMPHLPMLQSGENRISLNNIGPASAKLTTITTGDALKF